MYPRGGVVYVRRAPPAEHIDVIISAPAPGYVWVRGRWEWHTANFTWVPGVWVMLPPGRTVWVDGRWRQDRYGWYWLDGYWR